jgi:hypothetical protein
LLFLFLVAENETADDFIERIFLKYYSNLAATRKPSDFSLKIPGNIETISGNAAVVSFRYVKERLETDKKIELILIEKVFPPSNSLLPLSHHQPTNQQPNHSPKNWKSPSPKEFSIRAE